MQHFASAISVVRPPSNRCRCELLHLCQGVWALLRKCPAKRSRTTARKGSVLKRPDNESGREQNVAKAWPSRVNTRRYSLTARVGSGTVSRTHELTTMSKLLSRNGSRWTSATTDVAGTSLAWSSMAGERSAIVTFASGQILLTWRERAPLPLPASRTRTPGRSVAARSLSILASAADPA